VLVREERPADHPAVREVLLEAFGQPEEADLVAALRGSSAFLPSLSLVAESDGVLVGHILFTRLHVRGASRRPGLALAPMAVRKGQQRRGVGTALVRHGLAQARSTTPASASSARRDGASGLRSTSPRTR
jgi:putative acetyltransferase